MKTIIKLLAILSLVLLAQAVFAQTTISSCGFTTSSSGTYLVTQDLTQTGATMCISINASNVTLDCQGYRLQGDGTGTGIYGWGSNFVIKNCDIYSFSTGIRYGNASGSGGVIEYNKVVDSDSYGIYLASAQNALVRWNKGDDNGNALYLLNSNGNQIYENTFHRSVHQAMQCENGIGNDFIQNQVNSNENWGIYLSNCDDGEVGYNTANINGNGLHVLATSTGNEVYNNVFNRNDGYGINDADGSDTTNTYEGNVCKNNGDGPSLPTGLCK